MEQPVTALPVPALVPARVMALLFAFILAPDLGFAVRRRTYLKNYSPMQPWNSPRIPYSSRRWTSPAIAACQARRAGNSPLSRVPAR
jgi:hypothetical protein